MFNFKVLKCKFFHVYKTLFPVNVATQKDRSLIRDVNFTSATIRIATVVNHYTAMNQTFQY